MTACPPREGEGTHISALRGHALWLKKMERETGDEAPSTNQSVKFTYRLG